jgi:hypothetical protein
MLLSPRFQYLVGSFNIPALGAFVATTEQDYQRVTLLIEIDSVAWPVMNPKLTDALADRGNVTR